MRIVAHGKEYNPDTSQFICDVPGGALMRKVRKSKEFYIYNAHAATNKEMITPVSWPDANNYVKTYGSKEQWIELFTAYGKSTGVVGNENRVSLDDYHYLKALRNADRFKISVKEYICRLIDKDDHNNNYCK